jgi:hypothetical protein
VLPRYRTVSRKLTRQACKGNGATSGNLKLLAVEANGCLLLVSDGHLFIVIQYKYIDKR